MLLRPRQLPFSRIPRAVRSLALAILVLTVSASLISLGAGGLGDSRSATSELAMAPTVVDAVEGQVRPGAEVPLAVSSQGAAPPGAIHEQAEGHHAFVPALTRQGVAPPPPTPTPPPPPVVTAEFRALETRLAGMFANSGYAANIAVAVTDLQTGATVGVNPWQMQLSGCVLNLYVIVEALRMVQAGELTLGQVDALIYATTWSSNAATAYQLYGIVGGGDPLRGVERIRGLIDDLGLSIGVVADHPPSYPGVTLGIDPNNWVTPTDVNRTLARIYRGEVLDAKLTAYLLDALATVKPGLNYLTAAGVPWDVTVSHKNGFFPALDGTYVDNDAGIVRFVRNGTEYAYAVTFLSQDNPWKYGQIPLAQQMMAEIWAYFDATYPE